jgi:hypothetical protein
MKSNWPDSGFRCAFLPAVEAEQLAVSDKFSSFRFSRAKKSRLD